MLSPTTENTEQTEEIINLDWVQIRRASVDRPQMAGRFVVALGFALIAGCGGKDLERPAAHPDLPPQECLTTRDHTVISIVLDDFAASNDVVPGNSEPGKQQIIIDAHSGGPSWYLSDDQLNGELARESWTIPGDVRDNLRRRNEQTIAIDHGMDSRTIKEDLRQTSPQLSEELWDRLETKHPKAKAWITLWLPGYSKDNLQVVVRFDFGPSVHGATATYLLAMEGGRWKIKHRKIAHYA